MNSFTRFESLIGVKNLEKIKKTKVAIFGLGGVGSYVAEALARSGIENFILIDNDIIEETNLNRQLFALNSTIGKLKTQVAEERILDINPNTKISCINGFILPENQSEFLPKDFFETTDFIIDAVDTLALKIFLACRAEEKNIKIISAMGCGNRLEADFEFADIYKTSVCPLCKVMRCQLKKTGVKKLKVLYSKNPCTIKQNPPASAAWVPSIAGLLIAGEAIKTIIN